MKINSTEFISYLSLLLTLIFGITGCFISARSNKIANESLSMSKKSIQISNESNNISKEALGESRKSNQIQKEGNDITLTTISMGFAEKSYNEIYDNSENQTIMNIIKKSNGEVKNIEKLTKFIDIFEAVGGQYCLGKISQGDIRLYLGKSLEKVCRNLQIINTYGGQKNGIAILCDTFTVKSGFGKYLNKENLNTCSFK